jgi:hypothetical protein
VTLVAADASFEGSCAEEGSKETAKPNRMSRAKRTLLGIAINPH